MKKRLIAVCLTVFLLLGLAPTAFAAPIGTTPGNPVVVSLGQTYACSWTSSTDHLYCFNKITLPTSGMLHFQIDKLNDSEGELGRYDIVLYDADGDVVMSYDCSYSVDVPKSTYDFYIGLPAGIYTMSVKPNFLVLRGTFTANYSFTLDQIPCELEPNDGKSTATPLPLGQMLSAYFGNDGGDTGGENDYFKCKLTKGTRYRITFKNYEKLIEATTAIYEVYDPSGNRLSKLSNASYAFADDDGNTYWEFVAEASGVYYFLIENYSRQPIAYGLKLTEEAHTHVWKMDTQLRAPTCTEDGLARYSCTLCAETKTEAIPALGHNWNTPRYTWTSDCREITASRFCRNNIRHTETEKGRITSAVTRVATYETEGEITYTATFKNPAFATQTKVVTTPRLQAPTPTPSQNPFVDVPGNAYYYTPVLWAVQNGITSGTTPTTFSPNAGCTRAQVVAFLWRAAGSPMPGSSRNPFTDVKSNAYYYNAVLWAVENGITAGTSETTFSPDKICTRAQIVTFLWRYEDSPAPASDSNPFTDVNAGAYYAKAVLWASQTGVTAGLSSTTFGPETTCTRAQVVSFLYRDIAK